MREESLRKIGRAVLVWGLVVLAGIVPARGATAVAATGDAIENVRFRWAFGAIANSTQSSKLEPVMEDSVLKTGDKFKMLVELQQKCFVYLIYQSSQGELTMLFPYTLKQFDMDYEVSKKYYIPRGDAWFQLDDNIGRETFYLLASHQRLGEVEYLFNLYEASDQAKRKQIAGQMLAEIRNIEKQQREYATAVPNPVLASSKRGVERALGQDPSDVADISADVSSTDLYARTIIIEHR